jgi:hypothetical protein
VRTLSESSFITLHGSLFGKRILFDFPLLQVHNLVLRSSTRTSSPSPFQCPVVLVLVVLVVLVVLAGAVRVPTGTFQMAHH